MSSPLVTFSVAVPVNDGCQHVVLTRYLLANAAGGAAARPRRPPGPSSFVSVERARGRRSCKCDGRHRQQLQFVKSLGIETVSLSDMSSVMTDESGFHSSLRCGMHVVRCRAINPA